MLYALGVARAPAAAAMARDAPALRRMLIAWNVGMAVFSAWCTAIALPHFLWGARGALSHGLVAAVCSDAKWYSRGAVGAVSTAFTFSKFVELVDTLFLVLRRRVLTGLHTFHHAATLLLTWRLFVKRASTGLVFIAMNALVHTVMYAYFAAMLFPVARLVLRPRSQWITAMQIAQMAIGVVVNLAVANEITSGRICHVSPLCVAAAGALYTVYMILFVQFALSRSKAKRA